MKRNIIIAICCIILCFAFAGIAMADDEERITGEAEITSIDGTNLLKIDLLPNVKIFGLVDCSVTENKKQTKVSCNGQGLTILFVKIPFLGDIPIPLPLGEAVPVELEECTVQVCNGDGLCDLVQGQGQATLAANYFTGDLDITDIAANVSVTCIFKNPE